MRFKYFFQRRAVHSRFSEAVSLARLPVKVPYHIKETNSCSLSSK